MKTSRLRFYDNLRSTHEATPRLRVSQIKRWFLQMPEASLPILDRGLRAAMSTSTVSVTLPLCLLGNVVNVRFSMAPC